MIEGYKTCYEQIKFDPQNALEDKIHDLTLIISLCVSILMTFAIYN